MPLWRYLSVTLARGTEPGSFFKAAKHGWVIANAVGPPEMDVNTLVDEHNKAVSEEDVDFLNWMGNGGWELVHYEQIGDEYRHMIFKLPY